MRHWILRRTMPSCPPMSLPQRGRNREVSQTHSRISSACKEPSVAGVQAAGARGVACEGRRQGGGNGRRGRRSQLPTRKAHQDEKHAPLLSLQRRHKSTVGWGKVDGSGAPQGRTFQLRAVGHGFNMAPGTCPSSGGERAAVLAPHETCKAHIPAKLSFKLVPN